jgi:NAD(P)-dependent dehydrogenase (short-subunit alcohol dehydrogenase family)
MNLLFPRTRIDLTGRVDLVTGAGAGIGRAAADLFLQAGAAAGLHDRTSRGGAEPLAAVIRERGGGALLLEGDLAVESEAQHVDQLLEMPGGSTWSSTTRARRSPELGSRIARLNSGGRYSM